MLKKEYNNVFEPASELATLVFHHFGKTPMGWTGVDKLAEYAHNEQFAERVFKLVDFLSAKNELFDGINPSQYYKIIYKFQLATKSSHYSVEDICACYLYLANYAIRLYNRNIADLKHQVTSVNFSKDTNETISQVLYLSALTRSLSETLYYDEHTVSGEIYTFKCDDGVDFICRNYINCDASELYDSMSTFPYLKIKIYGKYYGLEKPLSTDIVGNLLTSENISLKLSAYYITTEDKWGRKEVISGATQIQRLCEIIEEHIRKLLAEHKVQSSQQRLWKKIECEYYAMKSFCDITNLDWRPVSYSIDEGIIACEQRPIVKANKQISFLDNDELVYQKLLELNNPLIHW